MDIEINEENLHLQEMAEAEETIKELKEKNRMLNLRLSRAKQQIDYMKDVEQANFSDLRWCSSLKYVPSSEKDELVYNVNGKYRIGFFDKNRFVCVNKFNGRTISFIKVLSWAYTDTDLYQNKKATPDKEKAKMSKYREERSQKFNAYCGVNQDVNPDDFEIEEKNLEIEISSGYIYDGYCPCGNSMDLYLNSEGNIYMNGEYICNISDKLSIMNEIYDYEED